MFFSHFNKFYYIEKIKIMHFLNVYTTKDETTFINVHVSVTEELLKHSFSKCILMTLPSNALTSENHK